MTATAQHITYSEFLPRVLGPEFTDSFRLRLEAKGRFYPGYDPSCSAGVTNEFATAAFRFGHTLVHPRFTLIERCGGRVLEVLSSSCYALCGRYKYSTRLVSLYNKF